MCVSVCVHSFVIVAEAVKPQSDFIAVLRTEERAQIEIL